MIDSKNRDRLKKLFSNTTPILKNNEFSFAPKDIYGNNLYITVKGNNISIKGIKDKALVLHFSRQSLPKILDSIPVLNGLQNKYEDKIIVISLELRGHTEKDIQDNMYKKGLNHIMLSIEDKEVEKFTNFIAEKAEWGGSIPFLITTNKDGGVEYLHQGYLTLKQFEKILGL